MPPATPPNPDIKFPSEWTHDPPAKTRTELLAQRKQARIPDITFDLDGDGTVGGQDLVLATLFDLDKDGKLNKDERRRADEAVTEGLAGKFVWGVEQSAPKRPFRLIQARGIVVDAEDFTGVAETYPVEQKSSPNARTFSELKKQRAKERVHSLQQYRETWEQTRPPQKLPEMKDYSLSDYPYKTWTQKRQAEIRAARVKNGLSPTCSDIDEKPCPSFSYISHPNHRSRSHMRESRRRAQLQDFQEKLSDTVLSPDERLEVREKEMAAKVGVGNGGKTYAEVKKKLRKEAHEHNTATFSKVVIGVHGHELPKFAEEEPEYWKLRPGYSPKPAKDSRLELLQSKKGDAPKDIYLLADKESSPPPPDPFKSTHVPRPKPQSPNPDSPARRPAVPYPLRNPADVLGSPIDKSNYRWTSLAHVFPRGDRTISLTPTSTSTAFISMQGGISPARAATPTVQQGRRLSVVSTGSRMVTRNVSASMVRSCGFSTGTLV